MQVGQHKKLDVCVCEVNRSAPIQIALGSRDIDWRNKHLWHDGMLSGVYGRADSEGTKVRQLHRLENICSFHPTSRRTIHQNLIRLTP